MRKLCEAIFGRGTKTVSAVGHWREKRISVFLRFLGIIWKLSHKLLYSWTSITKFKFISKQIFFKSSIFVLVTSLVNSPNHTRKAFCGLTKTLLNERIKFPWYAGLSGLKLSVSSSSDASLMMKNFNPFLRTRHPINYVGLERSSINYVSDHRNALSCSSFIFRAFPSSHFL